MPLISPHYLCVDWIPSVCQAGQHEHVRHASVKWFSAREIFRAMHDKNRAPQASTVQSPDRACRRTTASAHQHLRLISSRGPRRRRGCSRRDDGVERVALRLAAASPPRARRREVDGFGRREEAWGRAGGRPRSGKETSPDSARGRGLGGRSSGAVVDVGADGVDVL